MTLGQGSGMGPGTWGLWGLLEILRIDMFKILLLEVIKWVRKERLDFARPV